MTDKRKQEQKKAEETTKKLIHKIDQNPYDVQNYYELGTLLTEMQSFPQAEELFKKALTIFENDKELSLLHYGLGNVFYSTGLYQEAIEEFQQVSNNELKGNAYLMIAQSMYAQNNYQQAMAFALTASDQLPQDKAPKKLVADCLLALGDLKTAKSFYLQALEVDSKDAHTLFQLGLIEFTQESPQAGQEYFEKAKKIDERYFNKMKERLGDIQKTINLKDD